MTDDNRNSARNDPNLRFIYENDRDPLADLYEEGRARYVYDPVTGEGRYEPLVKRWRV